VTLDRRTTAGNVKPGSRARAPEGHREGRGRRGARAEPELVAAARERSDLRHGYPPGLRRVPGVPPGARRPVVTLDLHDAHGRGDPLLVCPQPGERRPGLLNRLEGVLQDGPTLHYHGVGLLQGPGHVRPRGPIALHDYLAAPALLLHEDREDIDALGQGPHEHVLRGVGRGLRIGA